MVGCGWGGRQAKARGWGRGEGPSRKEGREEEGRMTKGENYYCMTPFVISCLPDSLHAHFMLTI